MIHVFDLSHLEASVTDHITVPISNQRIIGNVNYELLKYITDNYIIKSEICNEHTTKENITVKNYFSESRECEVDLLEIIKEMKRNVQNFDLLKIRNILSTYFGLDVTIANNSNNIRIDNDSRFIHYSRPAKRKHSDVGEPSSSAKKGRQDVPPEADAAEEPPEEEVYVSQGSGLNYYIRGLLKKTNTISLEEEVYKNPQKNLLLAHLPERDWTSFGSNKEFVEYSIPNDQRFKINNTISAKFFEVVADLIRGKKVKPILEPAKDKEYKFLTAEDFLQSITKSFLDR